MKKLLLWALALMLLITVAGCGAAESVLPGAGTEETTPGSADALGGEAQSPPDAAEPKKTAAGPIATPGAAQSGDIPGEMGGEAVQTGSVEVVYAVQGEPQMLSPNMEMDETYAFADAADHTYFINGAEYDGREYLVLWREGPEGGKELMLNIAQPEEGALRHSLHYEGGLDESGGRFLFFTLCDALNYHRSLWVLDTENLYFNLFYDMPCSNMVIPDEPPADYKNVGWIVYDIYLIPIDLYNAKEITGSVIDLTEYYEPLGEELFYGIGDWGTHKYVDLTYLGKSTLGIEDVLEQPEDSDRRDVVTHQIDFSTLKFH